MISFLRTQNNIINVLANDNAKGTQSVTILTNQQNEVLVNVDNTITYTHNGTTRTDTYSYWS
jgi:hypothetical protein